MQVYTLAVHIDISIVAAKGSPSLQRLRPQFAVAFPTQPHDVCALGSYAHHNSSLSTQINFLYLFTVSET